VFFAEVTVMMRKGERLAPRDRAPPQRLMVTILEIDRDRNNSGLNLTQVSLYEAYGTARMAGRGSMTDPIIRPFSGKGILIAGTELDSEVGPDGVRKIFEHKQTWLCNPIPWDGYE
jgi:hypothetical protein